MCAVSSRPPAERCTHSRFGHRSMFNPYHNAHDDYFLINGTVAGSWEGIPPDVNLMNWGPPVACSCGGWGSKTARPPPGTCPCHIATAVPGGSSGTTTDYQAGLHFFGSRGLKQTIGGYCEQRVWRLLLSCMLVARAILCIAVRFRAISVLSTGSHRCRRHPQRLGLCGTGSVSRCVNQSRFTTID